MELGQKNDFFCKKGKNVKKSKIEKNMFYYSTGLHRSTT